MNKSKESKAKQVVEAPQVITEVKVEQSAKPKRKRSRSKSPVKPEAKVEITPSPVKKDNWIKTQYIKFLIWLNK